MDDSEDDLKVIIEEAFHDLNNHLAAVTGFSHVLQGGLKDLPAELDFADKILEAGEEATALCDQLAEVLKKHFDDGQ